jgi:hypothetical protein
MPIHQVLGVKLYSVVPNSMAEERTVSIFIKLNSAEHAAQKADTIVNITKVKQHLRRRTAKVRRASSSHMICHFSHHAFQRLVPRPVVRFCDISKYVKDTDRQAGSMKTSTDDALSLPAASSSTEPFLVAEPTEKVGESKEPEDRLWEDDCNDEEEEEEEENTVLKSAHKTASSTGMDVEVDDGVDVGVPQLRDYFRDRPAMSPQVDVREGPNAMKKAATRSSSTPRVIEVQENREMMLNDSQSATV